MVVVLYAGKAIILLREVNEITRRLHITIIENRAAHFKLTTLPSPNDIIDQYHVAS